MLHRSIWVYFCVSHVSVDIGWMRVGVVECADGGCVKRGVVTGAHDVIHQPHKHIEHYTYIYSCIVKYKIYIRRNVSSVLCNVIRSNIIHLISRWALLYLCQYWRSSIYWLYEPTNIISIDCVSKKRKWSCSHLSETRLLLGRFDKPSNKPGQQQLKCFKRIKKQTNFAMIAEINNDIWLLNWL